MSSASRCPLIDALSALLLPNWGLQVSQALAKLEDIVARQAERSVPIVFAGDFNSEPPPPETGSGTAAAGGPVSTPDAVDTTPVAVYQQLQGSALGLASAHSSVTGEEPAYALESHDPPHPRHPGCNRLGAACGFRLICFDSGVTFCIAPPLQGKR